jgi:hypothetical protein
VRLLALIEREPQSATVSPGSTPGPAPRP